MVYLDNFCTCLTIDLNSRMDPQSKSMKVLPQVFVRTSSANRVQDLKNGLFSLCIIQYLQERWSWDQNFVDSAVYYAPTWTKSASCCSVCKCCDPL